MGESLSLWPGAIVNVTGGTKPMAIGAYLAAQYQNEGVLYCDTARQRFEWLYDRSPLPTLPSMLEVAATLKVQSVMAAQGLPYATWKSQVATPELRRFGRTVFELKRRTAEAFSGSADFDEVLRRHFRPDGRQIPKRTVEWKQLLSTPLPKPPSEPAAELLRAAQAAGLLEQSGTGDFVPACVATRGALQHLANVLGGSWLELYVLDLLAASKKRFVDPHWSVEPVRQDEAAFGETDLVCVDSHHASLRIISCKADIPKQPLEHLAALAQRRRDLGGSHAKATLVVFQGEGAHIQQLKQWGALLDIQVVIGDQIEAALTE